MGRGRKRDCKKLTNAFLRQHVYDDESGALVPTRICRVTTERISDEDNGVMYVSSDNKTKSETFNWTECAYAQDIDRYVLELSWKVRVRTNKIGSGVVHHRSEL